jgi:antitoxin component of RelBE/YafQ-DinJ toxin-antitoxin module
MDTKLTLIIDHHVKEDAKKYAKEMGSSLSKLVENYLKLLTAKRKKTENEIPLGPFIESMRKKAVKVPADFDYNKELEAAIWEKHLKGYEKNID